MAAVNFVTRGRAAGGPLSIFAMETESSVPPLMTEVVTSTPHLRGLDAYFNRGILSTQSLARSLTAAGGVNVNVLQNAIKDPANSIRKALAGQHPGRRSVAAHPARQARRRLLCRTLLCRSYSALYELTDDFLIKQLETAKSKLRIVLSNNTGDSKKSYNSANQPARKRLKASGAELISRYLPDGRSIGHNKFMVYARTVRPCLRSSGSANLVFGFDQEFLQNFGASAFVLDNRWRRYVSYRATHGSVRSRPTAALQLIAST